jgi:hypothetical protein
MTIQPFSSVYKYTDPIRYFKANDPYFYEVDNIPLKQLQENCNFLKDQINGLAGGELFQNGESTEQIGRFRREDFDELLPYVNGTDAKVYVRPGKFIGRVNDAFSITPLQIIRQIFLAPTEDNTHNIYNFKSINDSDISALLTKFQTKLADNALSMNGLYERSFVRAVFNSDVNTNLLSNPSPGYEANIITNNAAFGNNNNTGPIFNQSNVQLTTTNVLPYTTITGHGLTYDIPSFLTNLTLKVVSEGNGVILDPYIEAQFIKRWRGVSRTAVVNVEETISIDIPEFSDEDYFYIDANGQRQQLTTDQRIDLVFIYTKPIDTSAVSISKFENNIPVKITRPVLGIVKGAGIGINLTSNANSLSTESKNVINLVDSEGNAMILPSISDELGVNLGIREEGDEVTVKGSFPSPDDLMNITPLLSENLEAGHIALVGQSILPVAYVIRKRLYPNVIPTTDIIDIRPFFRTAELSYNERAGLAAATPQVSIANPVASENYVDLAIKQVKDSINQISGGIPTNILTATTTPRIVRSGYIKGGLRFGVESTLTDYLKKTQGPFTSQAEVLNSLRSIYDYPTGTNFRNAPDWDLAEWVTRPGYTDRGSFETDYMNFAVSRERYDTYSVGRRNTGEYGWGYGTQHSQTSPNLGSSRRFGTYPNYQSSNQNPWNSNDARPNAGGYYSLCFVKKSFIVRKAPWVADIRVDARLFNCCPMSFATMFNYGANDRRQAPAGKFSNIWTSKRILSTTDVEVTIFVSWAVDLHGAEQDGEGLILPSFNRQRGDWFAGFLVLDNQMAKRIDQGNGSEGPWLPVVQGTYPNNIPAGFPTGVASGFSSQVGVALYPTVQFDIWGIPNSYGVGTDYGTANPLIVIQ